MLRSTYQRHLRRARAGIHTDGRNVVAEVEIRIVVAVRVSDISQTGINRVQSRPPANSPVRQVAPSVSRIQEHKGEGRTGADAEPEAEFQMHWCDELLYPGPVEHTSTRSILLPSRGGKTR